MTNALESLRRAKPCVLPSLLQCDFGNLKREVRALEEAGAPGLHLDVMDGRFVPNLTYGMPIVSAIRQLTDLPLDVHLMIEDPQRYVAAFRRAGADVITIHAEAAARPRDVLREIRASGAAAGLAINPGTPLEALSDCLEEMDLALIMSVPAGFGGQAFDPAALRRLESLRSRIADESLNVLLEVDGGVNFETAAPAAGAGAELLVAGSAIFAGGSYVEAISRLTSLAASVTDAS